jgi:Mg2+ and Co2+ transporter CorA
VRSWIDHSGEVVWDPSPSLITGLIEGGQPFWLDIENPTDEVIDQLATGLGLHPLVVAGSKQFGQRAKLQVYRNGVMLIGFGLDEELHSPSKCTATTRRDS